jgi:hypothetical protein
METDNSEKRIITQGEENGEVKRWKATLSFKSELCWVGRHGHRKLENERNLRGQQKVHWKLKLVFVPTFLFMLRTNLVVAAE